VGAASQASKTGWRHAGARAGADEKEDRVMLQGKASSTVRVGPALVRLAGLAALAAGTAVVWIGTGGAAALGSEATATAASQAATPPAASAGQGASAGQEAAARGPVVVELFTSQGCSSCPPADRLLSRLESERQLAGVTVIPLAFHVDYWNHQGWTDPFSSAAWSQRQQSYAHAFHSNQIYTPQLVVNGRTECVGSKEGEVLQRIHEALAAAPAAEVTLPVTADSPGQVAAGGHARVTVSARLLQPVGAGGADLWVALTQSGLVTAVGAGENAAATLHDDHVVRRLVKAFSLPAASGSERSARVTLDLDRGWKDGTFEVVAFLQDPQTLAIYGAAARPLAVH
jgi:hypothetical protein